MHLYRNGIRLVCLARLTVYCQTPVQVLGLGVDFVLPLSQEQEQEQQQEEEPHQNIPEVNILEVLNLAVTLTN